MRILVAEDDPVSRRVLQVVLERMGHECDVAENGDAAWARIKLAPPEVLITDWMMPGTDGPALCRRLRARHGEDCYVIMLTALNGDAHVRTAMEAGVDDFLTKPLERPLLALRLALAARLQALRTRVSELETRA